MASAFIVFIVTNTLPWYRGPMGPYPNAGVIRDSTGNLCGTALYGGTAGAGIVCVVDRAGQETPLYSFTGAADGVYGGRNVPFFLTVPMPTWTCGVALPASGRNERASVSGLFMLKAYHRAKQLSRGEIMPVDARSALAALDVEGGHDQPSLARAVFSRIFFVCLPRSVDFFGRDRLPWRWRLRSV